MTQDKRVDEFLDKQSLYELSVNYCCAVDRLDYGLMASLWWPESTVDVGVFKGNGLEYSEMITTPSEALKRSHHSISNPRYTLRGTVATGQVYVNAASTMVIESQEREALVGGRYVDEYEKRDGSWKFMFRSFVIDWAFTFDSGEIWAGDLMSVFPHQGRAYPDDFSYRYLK